MTTMSVIHLLAFVICVTSEVQAALECLTCGPGTDRDDCHEHHHCHSHEVCATHVIWRHGHAFYGFFCQDEKECYQRHYLIGKRQVTQSDSYQQLCHQCCHHNRCNKDLCHMVFNQQTTTHHNYHPTLEPGKHAVCLHCKHIKDPSACREHIICRSDQVCYTAAYHDRHTGENYFVTGCRVPQYYCAANMDLPDDMLCHGCCFHTQDCNRHICSQYVQHRTTQTTPLVTTQTTPLVTSPPVLPPSVSVNLTISEATTSMAPISTTAATTTTTSPVPTSSHQQPTHTDTIPFRRRTSFSDVPKVSGQATRGRCLHFKPYSSARDSCRDLEEDGLTCASLDVHHLCSDPSAFAYFLSHKKCPKYCGFCTSSTNTQTNSVNVTLPPANACMDFEQDGFPCDQLDLFHVCNGPTTLAYVVAHMKCRKYCGFCQPASTTTIPTTKATSTFPTTKAIPTTDATSTVKQTTGSPGCTDIEDQTFNCAEWTSHGFCLPFPGIGYDTAKLRCRKYCGFCH